VIIRKMDISEIAKCTDGAREFFAESDTFRGEFNILTFTETWKNLYDLDIGCFFILVDNEGSVQGGIGGLLYPDYITGIMAATEMFWYVRKPYRGKYGLALMNKYEQWAKEKGCKKVRMVHLIDLMPEKLRHFYELKGYHEIEITYEKELE